MPSPSCLLFGSSSGWIYRSTVLYSPLLQPPCARTTKKYVIGLLLPGYRGAINADRALVIRVGDPKFSAPLVVASNKLYVRGDSPDAADQVSVAPSVAAVTLVNPENTV